GGFAAGLIMAFNSLMHTYRIEGEAYLLAGFFLPLYAGNLIRLATRLRVKDGILAGLMLGALGWSSGYYAIDGMLLSLIMGGALAAIEAGYFQKELAREQYERHVALEDGSRKLVGVNHLRKENEKREIELFQLDDDAERRQIERLNKVRSERDDAAVKEALERVSEAARGDANLMPSILEAVKTYATQGEICNTLRQVFGEHHPDTLTEGV
ncbi:MAG: methylmalonyl-CoA mutase family protein, partial [bacterium]